MTWYARHSYQGMQNLTKGFQIIIFLKKGEEKTDDIWQKGFEFNSYSTKMVKKEFYAVIGTHIHIQMHVLYLDLSISTATSFIFLSNKENQKTAMSTILFFFKMINA